MSTMAIMDMLVMSKAGNGSARGTEYAAVKRETHRRYAIELKRRIVEKTFSPGHRYRHIVTTQEKPEFQ